MQAFLFVYISIYLPLSFLFIYAVLQATVLYLGYLKGLGVHITTSLLLSAKSISKWQSITLQIQLHPYALKQLTQLKVMNLLLHPLAPRTKQDGTMPHLHRTLRSHLMFWEHKWPSHLHLKVSLHLSGPEQAQQHYKLNPTPWLKLLFRSVSFLLEYMISQTIFYSGNFCRHLDQETTKLTSHQELARAIHTISLSFNLIETLQNHVCRSFFHSFFALGVFS